MTVNTAVKQILESVSGSNPPKTLLSRVLDTSGDGTGVTSAIANYANETILYIQPPAGTIYRIARMVVSIEDTGSFDSGTYGNGITLTNGITVRTADDSGVLADLTGGLPITTNAGWGSLCFDISLSTFGSGNEFLNVRWTFSKFGQEIELNGDNNERLEVVLQDDYTDLVSHRFRINGYIKQ